VSVYQPGSHFGIQWCHIPDVPSDHPDYELVQRTLAGDSAAFAPLVDRYRRAALARALAIVLDPLDADDVAQDAFLQAYEQLATLRDARRFEIWLMTIVHRRALNFVRADKRRRKEPLTNAIAAAHPDEASSALVASGSRERLIAALAQLSPVQRSVVLLADLEDWSHERIAASLGCSILMSRRHLSDARRRLRALLAPRERT
jgi:RNA polymerase sigma-70 factor (ECF subfamily)